MFVHNNETGTAYMYQLVIWKISYIMSPQMQNRQCSIMVTC